MKICIIKSIKIILIKINNFIIYISSNNSTKIKIDKSKPYDKDEAFLKILKLLNSNQFDYFISGGTLLGIYRDGKLIEWDDDIDIDVFSYSYRKNFRKIIEFANKYGYPYQLGSNYFHPKIYLCIANTKVSLGSITRGIFKRNYFYRSKLRIPYSLCKKTKNFKIKKNLYVKVPLRTEDFLQYVYGRNWSKPIRWEEDVKDYNNGYIRIGKRYILINNFQLLISKLIYLFKDYSSNMFFKK
jgi:hypothetical protein